jgi:hypothetical protein
MGVLKEARIAMVVGACVPLLLAAGAARLLHGQPPAPGSASVATGTITILLNGAVIGAAPVLNLQATSASGGASGILGTCVPDATLNSIDCNLNINSVFTATLDQVHANQNFCDSTNGTTGYTCDLPSKALLAYARGNAFLLAVDTTCVPGCSLTINGLQPPLTVYQSDGATAANGTPIAGHAVWVWFDGTVLRLV